MNPERFPEMSAWNDNAPARPDKGPAVVAWTLGFAAFAVVLAIGVAAWNLL